MTQTEKMVLRMKIKFTTDDEMADLIRKKFKLDKNQSFSFNDKN